MATTSQVPTFIAATALAAHRLVKLTAARTVGYAGAGDRAIGVVTLRADAASDYVAVELLNGGGTRKATAAAAISANALVYTAADGKISSVAAGNPLGIALESASGDGSVIEFVPFLPSLDSGDIANVFTYEHEFIKKIDATNDFVSAGDTSGTAATGDANGGTVVITTDVTNNDQWHISSVNEFFKITAGKIAVFEARLSSTQGETNKSAFFLGFSDDVSADQNADTTGAVRGTFDGFGVYKISGDLNIRVVTSNGATQTAEDSGADLVSATMFAYKAVITPVSATTFQIQHYIDGALVKTHTGLYSGMDEMHFLASTKIAGGGGASVAVLTVDYVRLVAQR